MIAHYTRRSRVNGVFTLFIFYVVVMILLCYYEFIGHQIFMLYVIVVLCGIGQLGSIAIFIEKAKHFQDEYLTIWLRKLLASFSLVFLIMLVLTPFPVVGAKC